MCIFGSDAAPPALPPTPPPPPPEPEPTATSVSRPEGASARRRLAARLGSRQLQIPLNNSNNLNVPR